MSSNQRFPSFALLLSQALAIAVCLFTACNSQSTASGSNHETQPVPYKILKDEMGFNLHIGVQWQVNEAQLKATLVKAATEHQNDPARDYLMSEYLWVEAYLEKDGRHSSAPAGRLRRYVPARNGAPGDDSPEAVEKEDKFFITLEEARKTLE